MRRVHFHSVLALLLVFTQQVGFAHLASHAAQRLTDQTQQDKTHPSESLCEKCVQFASLGTSPPATPYVLEFVPTKSPQFESVAHSSESRTVAPYQSRAPPVLL